MGQAMKIFKTCSCCKTPWYSRDEFLEDCDIDLVGYQVNFGDLVLGIFLFNHATCESTIGIPAGLFKDLHERKRIILFPDMGHPVESGVTAD